jgi:endonuclease YncB( thermonuclease family)
MTRWYWRYLVAALVSLMMFSVLPPLVQRRAPAFAQTGCRTFQETGRTVCGRFLQYWDQHGGLAQQGFPISSELGEVSPADGKSYTVQYFERAVFEYHPELLPPNTVLLSLLGVAQYQQKYPLGATGQMPDQQEGSAYFPETGKRVGPVFLQYWRVHGGLMQQGYPISDEFQEFSPLDGAPYLVQYFERAVFEYHPEKAPPNNVLLSQLGVFLYKARYAEDGLPIGSAGNGNGSGAASGSNISATVVRVVDGDTVEVLINGLRYRVRYIGMDTPETVDPSKPVQCYGKEASEANRRLVEGRTVTLVKDVSEVDKYGRLLRYLYVGDLFINAELVKQGYARVATYPPDIRYASLFVSLEQEARAAARGLWGPAGNDGGACIPTPTPTLAGQPPTLPTSTSGVPPPVNTPTMIPGSTPCGAICNDGWVSSSTGSGTCSSHGGVKEWIYSNCPPPATATRVPTPRPQPTAPPSGARCGAVCRDGSTSSATGSGACSHHGGVDHWIYCDLVK